MANTLEETVVRKSALVKAPVERAFSVFVEQMETWWPPAHHIGTEPFQSIFVEPRAGGRWYERDAQGNQCDWGTVLAWDAPHGVTLSWHLGPDWKFNADLEKASEIEIRFTGQGSDSTLVELEHSKLDRHGEGYEKLYAALNSSDAWEATLAAFKKCVETN